MLVCEACPCAEQNFFVNGHVAEMIAKPFYRKRSDVWELSRIVSLNWLMIFIYDYRCLITCNLNMIIHDY